MFWENATERQVARIQYDLRDYDSPRNLRTNMISKQEASDIIKLDDDKEAVRLVEAKIKQWKMDKIALGTEYN